MNISPTLMLTIGLIAFSLFIILLGISFIIVRRNRRKYKQAVKCNSITEDRNNQ